MKNLVNNNYISFNKYGLLSHKKAEDARIIDFKPDRNNHYILKIKIDNINKDNYKILMEKEKLSVILFKTIEIERPFHTHNFTDRENFDNLNYDDLESFDFTLPGKNYYLINHKAHPLRNMLEITLGKIHYN